MFDHITRDRRQVGGRAMGAMAASVLVHLLIVAGLFWGLREGGVLFADAPAGPGLFPDEAPGGGGGGGGGEQVTYYDIPAPPAPAPTPVPVEEEEVLVPPEPVPPPPPVETPKQPDAVPTPQPQPVVPTPGQGNAGSGNGSGTGEGTGTGTGTGSGSGSGSGSGDGSGTGSGQGPGRGGSGSISPPTWDFLIIPPQRPRGMASRDIEIRVRVDERGAVKEVQLNPATGNRGYDEALRRMARDWRFNPARDENNRPVEAWTPVTITI